MRRPTALLAAVLVAAAGVSGCGTSDDDEVRAVVERFADAGSKRNYQRICDELITSALSQKVEQIGLPCEVAFRQGLKDVRDPRVIVRSVKIDGDRARVGVHSTAANQPSSDDTLEVVKVDGEWRISSLVGGGGDTQTTPGQGEQPQRTTSVPTTTG